MEEINIENTLDTFHEIDKKQLEEERRELLEQTQKDQEDTP